MASVAACFDAIKSVLSASVDSPQAQCVIV